jgi:hypothetical protein
MSDDLWKLIQINVARAISSYNNAGFRDVFRETVTGGTYDYGWRRSVSRTDSLVISYGERGGTVLISSVFALLEPLKKPLHQVLRYNSCTGQFDISDPHLVTAPCRLVFLDCGMSHKAIRLDGPWVQDLEKLPELLQVAYDRAVAAEKNATETTERRERIAQRHDAAKYTEMWHGK